MNQQAPAERVVWQIRKEPHPDNSALQWRASHPEGISFYARSRERVCELVREETERRKK